MDWQCCRIKFYHQQQATTATADSVAVPAACCSRTNTLSSGRSKASRRPRPAVGTKWSCSSTSYSYRSTIDRCHLLFRSEIPARVSSQPTVKKAVPTAAAAPPVVAAPATTPVTGGPPGTEIPRQESPQPLQYGPGPSLRPQTEGSWVQGGRGPASHTQPSLMGPGQSFA